MLLRGGVRGLSHAAAGGNLPFGKEEAAWRIELKCKEVFGLVLPGTKGHLPLPRPPIL